MILAEHQNDALFLMEVTKLLEFVSTAADGFLSPNGESLPENEATPRKIETREKGTFQPIDPTTLHSCF